MRGVWRDYARQHGAIAIDADDVRAPHRRHARQRSGVVARAGRRPRRGASGVARSWPATTVEFATRRELRAASLTIFDRSFAVTRWLQIVAIGIGLAGIAASFSAQVLARRREFGLLAHLGVTRGEVLAIVAAEGLRLERRRRRARPAARRRRERGAGVRRQSAELSLDHGAAAAWRAPCGAGCCGAGCAGTLTAALAARAQRGPRRRARGEGGLVMRRRALLLHAARSCWRGFCRCVPPQTIRPRVLVFPRDHGAHPATRVEWWYITGALETEVECALRLADHVLSRAHRRRARSPERIRREADRVRARGAHRRRAAPAAARRADRARRLRHRRAPPRTTRGSRCATGRWCAATTASIARAHPAAARPSASTSRSFRLSRRCCKATPAGRARVRAPSRRATTIAAATGGERHARASTAARCRCAAAPGSTMNGATRISIARRSAGTGSA